MRFVCDHMLGTLAKWLRFLGYDTGYPDALDDDDLKALAVVEDRVLLTRDYELSGRVAGAIYIESDVLDEQFAQVVRAFGLTAKDEMTRCSVCNALIKFTTQNILPIPKLLIQLVCRWTFCRDRIPALLH